MLPQEFTCLFLLFDFSILQIVFVRSFYFQGLKSIYDAQETDRKSSIFERRFAAHSVCVPVAGILYDLGVFTKADFIHRLILKAEFLLGEVRKAHEPAQLEELKVCGKWALYF